LENRPIVFKFAGGSDRTTFSMGAGIPEFGDGKFYAHLERASDDVDFSTGSLFHATGVWHYVTGVYDGSNLRIYVDGVQESSTNIGSVVAYTGTDPLWIGKDPNRWFNGMVDEVRIYNRALSAGEVQRLYDLGQ
jgi:hypothetical protein